MDTGNLSIDLREHEFGRQTSPAYYAETDNFYIATVPPGKRVLELGCGTGRLLAALRPRAGVGVDAAEERVRVARALHAERPELTFTAGNAESIDGSAYTEPFDYIILSDLIPVLTDVQHTLSQLHAVSAPHTRIIIQFPSNLWRPVLFLASWLGLRTQDRIFNWLSLKDVVNILYLADFDVVTKKGRILLPLHIPLVTKIINRILARIPLLNMLCLSWFVIARPHPCATKKKKDPSVSIVIPTRNEKGTIEDAFRRIPAMGAWTELVFVDGDSSDGTVEEIKRCKEKYRHAWHNISLVRQQGRGKGPAVRQGFAAAAGDIFMILDSDLTMPPEELPKYYNALVAGHGEFINGCRLVYSPEKKSMRFLNMIANYFFAQLFTWLLDQNIKDTLCGTKVLWKRDYEKISENRSCFGDFDPFGDFDLLFGAAKLNLKIIDLPIRYQDRTYGEIKIDRWRDGLLLLRMSLIALQKLKFN